LVYFKQNVHNIKGDIMDFLLLIIKSVSSLLILFIFTDALGKKQINQLNMFDYVVGISIGNIVAEMTVNKEVLFFDGVIVMGVYSLIAIIISFATTKSIILRRLIGGTPTVLMENGKIIEEGLNRGQWLLLCQRRSQTHRRGRPLG
jgi:uncharacterized membrane protein YcaP (DUF421 family)